MSRRAVRDLVSRSIREQVLLGFHKPPHLDEDALQKVLDLYSASRTDSCDFLERGEKVLVGSVDDPNIEFQLSECAVSACQDCCCGKGIQCAVDGTRSLHVSRTLRGATSES